MTRARATPDLPAELRAHHTALLSVRALLHDGRRGVARRRVRPCG